MAILSVCEFLGRNRNGIFLENSTINRKLLMEVNQLIVWFAWYQQENITFLIWEET